MQNEKFYTHTISVENWEPFELAYLGLATMLGRIYDNKLLDKESVEKLRKMAKFHYDNPLIYQLFKKYTFEKIKEGKKSYSAEAVLNRVRWDEDVKTDGSEYKIPNKMKPFYSRLFCQKHQRYYEFFEKRKSICDVLNYNIIYEKL